MTSTRPHIHEVSDLLLDFAVSLMGAGTHTSRVARNVSRIASSFGYGIDIIIFQKTVMMTITHLEDSNVRHTSVKKIKPTALNFSTISELSRLSWDVYDGHLSITDIRERYYRIVTTPRMSRWAVLGLVACANAAFCRLFTGDVVAMGIVFLATLIAFYVRQEMMNRHANHLVVFVVCAFIASMIAGLTGFTWNIGTQTPQIAMGTSVLFLIPGVPLINGIIDMLEGYVLAGTSRMINACMLIVCIAMGLSLSLLILGIDKL